jgi:TonB family protein
MNNQKWQALLCEGEGISARNCEVEYHLTIIESGGLLTRLQNQLRYLADECRLAWPELKQDPVGFTRRIYRAIPRVALRLLGPPEALFAVTTAVLVVCVAIVSIFIIERNQRELRGAVLARDGVREDLELKQLILGNPERTPPDRGIGVGEHGQVGLTIGKGEGSKPKFEKSSGGGGGGQHNLLPAQQGKATSPSNIPAAVPVLPTAAPVLLPTAGIDIDPALYKNISFDRYGDPRSKSTEISAGPGAGNGMGNGDGTGFGVGEGPGFGPGRNGNMGSGEKGIGGGGVGGAVSSNPDYYNQPFRADHVTQKAKIVSKPEPKYTEEARKNGVIGTVVLRAVLSSSGEVTSIKAVNPLPYGLTEKAIAAAREIKFIPARKDGHTVSQWIQIEYNFNLY